MLFCSFFFQSGNLISAYQQFYWQETLNLQGVCTYGSCLLVFFFFPPDIQYDNSRKTLTIRGLMSSTWYELFQGRRVVAAAASRLFVRVCESVCLSQQDSKWVCGCWHEVVQWMCVCVWGGVYNLNLSSVVMICRTTLVCSVPVLLLKGLSDKVGPHNQSESDKRLCQLHQGRSCDEKTPQSSFWFLELHWSNLL